MKNRYKHEMEQLGPRQDELERLYAMIEGGTEMKHTKKFGARIAVIAVCAALLVTAATAAVAPAVWENLAAHLGIFAPYAKTIEGAACSDQGIEVQVLSALSDDLEARVYLSVKDVEEDRLNEFLTLEGRLTAGELNDPEKDPENFIAVVGGNATNYFKLVSYDPAEKTALFCANIYYLDGSRPTGEATLSITGMGTEKATLYAQPAGNNLSCADLTGEMLDSLPASEGDLVVFDPETLEGGGVDNSVLPGEHVVLAPGQTPMDLAGTEDFRISSIGFASDGRFHVRLEFADGVAPETYEATNFDTETGVRTSVGQRSLLHCDLLDGNEIDAKMYSIRETLVEGGMDILFPLITVDNLEELQGWELRVYGSYTRPGTAVEGDWSTEFALDYYRSTVLDWAGELAGWQVRQVTVSPLSVTMQSNNTGSFGTTLYAVKQDGTTVATEPGTSSYTNLDAFARLGMAVEGEGYDAFNTWKFEEPVEVEDIVSLKLGDETIPVK